MHVLDRVIPAGADIFVDAGNTGAAAVHYLGARQHGRYVVALGMGAWDMPSVRVSAVRSRGQAVPL